VSYDDATRARLVGLFVAEAEETLESLLRISGRLRERARKEDLSEFGRIAHGLKGAAAALGYEALSQALHALEDLALGLRGETGPAAEARQVRLSRALAVLGEGVARMSATGQDGFPGDLLPPLLAAVAAGGGAPAADAPGAAPAAPTPDATERLSVPAQDVDEAMRIASSLARSASQLQEALAAGGGSFSAAALALARSAQGLETIIASLRLLPAEAALSGLDEEVAQLAARLGKRVGLHLAGREVRADRRTLQSARGLIRHLVRNAVDHGVEAPEARRASGKDPVGRLSVQVEAAESALRVSVSDDGGGFDVDTIRREMIRRTGEPDRVGALSDEEVLRSWAFEGGSTRATADQISGRGLGLSAVASMARAVGGGFQVRSVRGLGSTVVFTLPLEVYAAEILTVAAGGRAHGLPLQAVERSIHLAAVEGAVHDGPAGRTLAVGETILPLVRLADALGIAGATGEDRFAVVVRAEGTAVALAVEDIGSAVGVVPTAVAGLAQADALVTGVARLGDGGAVAIVNPRLLLERARAARSAPATARPESPRRAAPAPDRAPARTAPPAALDVVLAEDSLATREVLRVLLEEQGFRVRLAGDGEEALVRVGERLPDVLVSDVNMPRRDGLSLTQEIRRRSETARLPVILLTSRDDDASRSAGARAGADAYLVKSRFNAAVLLDTLARIGVRAQR
jgi:chemotaxis protein histidine kinase CheA/CheY-like chemotaxis protein